MASRVIIQKDIIRKTLKINRYMTVEVSHFSCSHKIEKSEFKLKIFTGYTSSHVKHLDGLSHLFFASGLKNILY